MCILESIFCKNKGKTEELNPGSGLSKIYGALEMPKPRNSNLKWTGLSELLRERFGNTSRVLVPSVGEKQLKLHLMGVLSLLRDPSDLRCPESAMQIWPEEAFHKVMNSSFPFLRDHMLFLMKGKGFPKERIKMHEKLVSETDLSVVFNYFCQIKN